MRGRRQDRREERQQDRGFGRHGSDKACYRIEGFDGLWLDLALIADIVSYSSSASVNQDGIPGYTSR